MDAHKERELRLVAGNDEPDTEELGDDSAQADTDQGDLVAAIIRETGLLPPETVDAVRERASGTSFSQALLEEGLASALGVARALAEQYHLPLVDLAVAGVDGEAAKTIALPVLERACAIPFAASGA